MVDPVEVPDPLVAAAAAVVVMEEEVETVVECPMIAIDAVVTIAEVLMTVEVPTITTGAAEAAALMTTGMP